jgi:ESCRT-I complex subunit VPS37
MQEFQTPRAQPPIQPSDSRMGHRSLTPRTDGSKTISTPPSSIHDPRLESIYGDLKNLSLRELNDLLHQDSQVVGYVKKIDLSTNLRKIIVELKRENQQLARDNMEFVPKFESSRNSLLDKENQLKHLLQEYQTLLATHQDLLLKRYSAASLLAKLKKQADQSDLEADTMIRQFREGSMSADEFVRHYRQSRKLFHLRTCLAEKLSNLSSRSYK